MSITPFCQRCTAYFPTGTRCSACGRTRTVAEIPPGPGQELWRATLPGSAAQRLTLTRLEGRSVVLVPWNFTPQRGDLRPPDGGLALLDTTDGSEIWNHALGERVVGGIQTLGGTVFVGTSHLGGGTLGGTVAAFNLAQAEVGWRSRLEGAVYAEPIVDEVRLYVADCNGVLNCLDARDGTLLWQQGVADEGTVITAAPLLLREKGRTQAILVVTHGRRYGRVPGRIVALGTQGNLLWEQEVDGNARGTPVFANRWIYVTVYGERPSRGLLLALNARNGEEWWAFSRQGDAGSYNFSAAPFLHRDTVYVTSLDHHLYALDAETGALRWQHDVGKGSACQPVWLRGLILFGANDGNVYAVDAETGERAWAYHLGGRIFTTPQPFSGGVLVANDRGDVAALPWHLGHYAWAAERLEHAGRFSQAGDCRALAAHHAHEVEERQAARLRAQADWERAGEHEKVGALWQALDRYEQAAESFKQAGEQWRHKDACRAAGYFKRAGDLYFDLRQAVPLAACTRALSLCAQLPHLRLEPVGTGFIQWEPSKFTLRLTNEGQRPARNVRLCLLGGALQEPLEITFSKPLLPGQSWNVPLTVTPTLPQSDVRVELTYAAGEAGYDPLRTLLELPIRAAERPRPAVQIGDVGMLRMEIAGSTEEGVTINTQDVGLLRSESRGE